MNKKIVTVFLILVILISIQQIIAHRTWSASGERMERLQQGRSIFPAGLQIMSEHSLIRFVLAIIALIGLVLTIGMSIDCAMNRRDAYWFLILWLLAPIGVVWYMIYFWDQITFPCKIASLDLCGCQGALRIARCPLCQRSGVKLVPFEDGRQVQHICEMCR